MNGDLLVAVRGLLILGTIAWIGVMVLLLCAIGNHKLNDKVNADMQEFFARALSYAALALHVVAACLTWSAQ